MILELVGDPHGQVKDLPPRDTDNLRILIGDMGIGFPGVVYPTFDDNVGFIHGNHDNPEECKKHPNYLGRFGVWNDIFFVSGAYTPPLLYDIRPGINWWFDEQLGFAEMEACFALYKETRPRVVVSHDCPQFLVWELLRYINNGHSTEYVNNTGRLLDALWGFHRPDFWAFGHWHTDFTRKILNTHFQCIPANTLVTAYY